MNGETENDLGGGTHSWAKNIQQAKCKTFRKTVVLGPVTRGSLRFNVDPEDIYPLPGITKYYCFGFICDHIVWYRDILCTCDSCLNSHWTTPECQNPDFCGRFWNKRVKDWFNYGLHSLSLKAAKSLPGNEVTLVRGKASRIDGVKNPLRFTPLKIAGARKDVRRMQEERAQRSVALALPPSPEYQGSPQPHEITPPPPQP